MIETYKEAETTETAAPLVSRLGPKRSKSTFQNIPESYQMFRFFLELKENDDLEHLQEIISNDLLNYFEKEGIVSYSFMQENGIFVNFLELMNLHEELREPIFCLIDKIISRNPQLIPLFLTSDENNLLLIIRQIFYIFINSENYESVNELIFRLSINIIYNLCDQEQELSYMNELGYFPILSGVLHKSINLQLNDNLRLLFSLKILFFSNKTRINNELSTMFDIFHHCFVDGNCEHLIPLICSIFSDLLDINENYIFAFYKQGFYQFFIEYLNSNLENKTIPSLQLTTVILKSLNICQEEDDDDANRQELIEKNNEIVSIFNSELIFHCIYSIITETEINEENESIVSNLIDILQQIISIRVEFPFEPNQLETLYENIETKGTMNVKESYQLFILGLFQVLQNDMLHDILGMKFLHRFFADFSECDLLTNKYTSFFIEAISSILNKVNATTPFLFDQNFLVDESDTILSNKYFLISQLIPAVLVELSSDERIEIDGFLNSIEKDYYNSLPKDTYQNIINNVYYPNELQ